MSTAIAIEGVTKRFGGVVAVDDLDLEVPRGSLYGFIGPNGSGKSTTLRMIMHILLPDQGEIEVLGQRDTRAAHDRVSYLPEERGLYKRMSVRRLLRYFGSLKGASQPELDLSIDRWLERMGLSAWIDKKIDALSKGMAQKVQFIATVLNRPDLLILDEPFTGLDPVNAEVLKDAVLELKRAGTTVVFSTHDMSVAERLCDRIFMIFKGRKVLDGTLDEIQSIYGYDTIRVRTEAGAERLSQPVQVENLELVERTSESESGSAVKSAEKVDMVRTAGVPAALMFIMFFVIMTSAPQLLNSVIEEKMSRISEVLLGSVTPFELMMGKLLGNAGIAMVLAALYVGGGFAVAAYYGYANVMSPGLIAALVLFLFLAILLYGSLYTAVGAACSELEDAQSLMMPVMLLSMLPIFVWTAVLKNPASPLSVGMSLLPPASPFLMLMRLALRPAPPAWQVVLSVVLTTLTAMAIVWAAGKIFRTGLLMQGKPPSFVELARWVMAK